MLPVDLVREDFRASLATSNRLVLTAPAGSGKSTLVPGFLCDDVLGSDGQVWVLQPRRMAARMLCRFVARTRGGVPGGEVGYRIRFESAVSSRTRILFLTEGVLLRRLLAGDGLEQVGALVFDEFHERHLETDITLALSLRAQQKNPALKLVVMSATLDAGSVAAYLGGCPLLEASGRTYPVDIRYLKAPDARPIWDVAASALEREVPRVDKGTVLVFMPGAFEIRKTIQSLADKPFLRGIPVFPLYGALSEKEQDLAVQPHHGVRILVSTNVAETSLTIPGVVGVIDSGLVRVARYDHRRGIDTLYVQPNSMASADQRAGRAGRTAPGWCLRLWTEAMHAQRPAREVPEIMRVDISSVLLAMRASGTLLRGAEWFEEPHPDRVREALELLHYLGALDAPDDSARVTNVGARMARLPLSPRYARLLIEAGMTGCLGPACVVVALAQGPGLFRPFSGPEQKEECWHFFGEPESDLIMEYLAWIRARSEGPLSSVWARFGIQTGEVTKAAQAGFQLLGEVAPLFPGTPAVLPSLLPSMTEMHCLQRAILCGFADRLALRVSSGSPHYKLIQGVSGRLMPDSFVHQASLVVATEIEEVQRHKGSEILLRKATAVDVHQVRELFPDRIFRKTMVRFIPAMGRVMEVEEEWLQQMMLSSLVRETTDEDAAAGILADLVSDGVASLPLWTPAVDHYIQRMNFAAKYGSDFGLHPVDEQARKWMVRQIVLGARNLRDLERKDPWPVVRGWLSSAQQAVLDDLAPEKISFPHRKRPARLRYEAGGEVVLSETVQYFYDCPNQIFVGGGKAPVLFELLSPAGRPVQRTRDLGAFWKDSYLEVKKQLRGRYPKHEWR